MADEGFVLKQIEHFEKKKENQELANGNFIYLKNTANISTNLPKMEHQDERDDGLDAEVLAALLDNEGVRGVFTQAYNLTSSRRSNRGTSPGRGQDKSANFSFGLEEIDASFSHRAEADCPQRNQPRTHRKERGDKIFEGKYLSVSPSSHLVFKVTDPEKEASEILTLTNTQLTNKVAFKVKTTSPEKYRVRPSSGVLNAGSSTDVIVHLQPGVTDASRDKFLVLAMDLGIEDPLNNGELIADRWRAEPRSNIMEHRLRTIVIDRGKSATENPEKPVMPMQFGTEESNLLNRKIREINEKLDNIMRAQQTREKQLTQIYHFQLFLCLAVVFIAFAGAIMHKTGGPPQPKYTVSMCLPNFMDYF